LCQTAARRGSSWTFRFVPWVARDETGSGFVTFRDRPEPERLGAMAGPMVTAELTVDGILSETGAALRIVQAAGGFVLHQRLIAGSSRAPATLLQAWASAVAELLEVDLELPGLMSMAAAPVLSWLAAADAQLAVEANLDRGSPVAGVQAAVESLQAEPNWQPAWECLFALLPACIERGDEDAAAMARDALASLHARVPERADHHAVHDLQHADHAVAIGKQINCQRGISLPSKLAGNITNVIVQTEYLMDDDYAGKRPSPFRFHKI
jgi:hypothetical protein